MSVDRLVRINELLRREISAVLYREMAGTNFRFELVTVTRVEISSNLRQARVYVSIRGTPVEVERTLGELRRHRGRLQGFLKRDVILKYTPVLQFIQDGSIAQGDHVLDILSKLPEPAHDSEPAPPDAAPSTPDKPS